MIGRRCALFALGTLLILVLGVNIYFIRTIVDNSSQRIYSRNLPVSEPKAKQDLPTSSRLNEKDSLPRLKPIARDISERIKEEIRTLPSKYFKQNTSYSLVLERLLAELRIMTSARENIWNIPNTNVSFGKILKKFISFYNIFGDILEILNSENKIFI